MGNGLDDLPERNVVIGHISSRRAFASRHAKGVVIGQTDDLQTRHISFVFKSFEFRDKTLRALCIVKIQIKPPIAFTDMALQIFDPGRRRLGRTGKQHTQPSLTPIPHPSLLSPLPTIPPTTKPYSH